MPSRRQIRETVIQFLYCSYLEGGSNPLDLRGPFWEFITESDRKALHVAVFRTIHHLAIGRDARIQEFTSRFDQACSFLAAYPEAESLKSTLVRIAQLEAIWSSDLAKLERIPKDDHDDSVAAAIDHALTQFFKTDHSLVEARARFLTELDDFPAIRGPLEPVSGSIRRLQRISDRIRMVENPEHFPDQSDLKKIRESKADLLELQEQTNSIVDQILHNRPAIDAQIAEVVENFAPERIDPVDRAILRLATFELLKTQTPAKIIINEAIELAKRFGSNDSGRFVNGILDQIAKAKEAATL